MSNQVWLWVGLAIVVLVLLVVVGLRARGRADIEASRPERADAPAPPANPPADPVVEDPPAPGVASADTPVAAAPPAADEPAPEEPAPAVPTDAAPPGAPDSNGAVGDAGGRSVVGPADSALAALDSARLGPPAATSGSAATSSSAAAQVVSDAVTRPGPHRGSALPAPDGSAPSPDYSVKVNTGSKRYHPPESTFYVRTRADLWFRSAEDAEQAGFTAWNGRPAAG